MRLYTTNHLHIQILKLLVIYTLPPFLKVIAVNWNRDPEKLYSLVINLV